MEDVKWLVRKFGLLFMVLLITMIAGIIFWGKMCGIHKNLVEEVWEPPVEIQSIKVIDDEDSTTEDSEESAYWFLPETTTCLITEREKEQLQREALSAANQIREIYKDAEFEEEDSIYSSGICRFTGEQRKRVVIELGKYGFISVEEDTNMQNYEKLETFYREYLSEGEAMVTVYEVNRDGLIGARTFIYRRGDLQTYYVGIRWAEGGIPEIQGSLANNLAEIKLTEKGYFIYAYENVIAHASLRQYYRVKPLSDICRELTKKYVFGLSYVNYNMLVTNWDSSNVEDILMPRMFEDIYRIYTGKNLKTENWEIPADIYEKIMTTYFPVSKEKLRNHCGYIENNDSYPYEMIYASPYAPFGEVVDYSENKDGTITLIVDGVWPDYNSDCAFSNCIVVQPFQDGTFRYLSNSIEKKELDIPIVK